MPGAEVQILDDLRWLGIDWDEGPDVGGVFAPYRQSDRFDRYHHAIASLVSSEAVYPCRVSRRELREVASAPHASDEVAFPTSLRPTSISEDWFETFGARNEQAIRFRVDEGLTEFNDLLLGHVVQDVALDTGDFVLRRRDGLFAYQLAVVVDDIDMNITEVVRGNDILSSTGRQLLLRKILGGPACDHAHLPLMLNESGEKLSKRDESLTIVQIRADGIRSDQLIGYLAWTLGLQKVPNPATARELVETFDWSQISHEPIIVENDILRRLRQI
jgi:glutamyl-tRNA synthetase